jgi:GR25 family glycosyltransferase involved in LPS biosynthesis
MRDCGIIMISVLGSRRHRLLEDHLSELGVGAQVVPAIFLNGDLERASDYDLRMRMKILGYGLTNGEVGCFLAHRSAWEKVAASDRP